jgi:hypothetical protein
MAGASLTRLLAACRALRTGLCSPHECPTRGPVDGSGVAPGAMPGDRGPGERAGGRHRRRFERLPRAAPGGSQARHQTQARNRTASRSSAVFPAMLQRCGLHLFRATGARRRASRADTGTRLATFLTTARLRRLARGARLLGFDRCPGVVPDSRSDRRDESTRTFARTWPRESSDGTNHYRHRTGGGSFFPALTGGPVHQWPASSPRRHLNHGVIHPMQGFASPTTCSCTPHRFCPSLAGHWSID